MEVIGGHPSSASRHRVAKNRKERRRAAEIDARLVDSGVGTGYHSAETTFIDYFWRLDRRLHRLRSYRRKHRHSCCRTSVGLCSDRCRSEGSTKRRYLWGNAVKPVLRLGRSKVKHRAIERERRPQRRQGRPRLRRLRASSEMALAIPIAVMVITVVPAIVAAVPAAMVITAMIIAVPPAPCLGFV